ncbi:MAG: DUF4919 domain-containing protein [Bacteroidales bacterium]|nr:DUF4919 domain-containing protein [Bacteroidales bacterium]
MQRILFALFTLALSLTASAARPDLSGIAANVKANPAAYTALLNRFNAPDSTLTAEEVATVYYGAPAAGMAPAADYSEINNLRLQRRFADMLALSTEALKADPVSLTLLFRTFAGAYNSNDAATVESARVRINQLCDAIFASGSGVTEAEPFCVVSEADVEPFLVNYLYVDHIIGMAHQGPLVVAQVQLPGREEPAYLYFLPTSR